MFFLILAAGIVIYLSFVLINGNLSKKVAVTAKLLQNKNVHNTTFQKVS